MTTRHRDDYTAPVQLESLLEVPVKLILIEDLIREKAALASSGSVSYPRDKENEEENDYRRTGNGTVCPKKCLFDCCATPSRWRNTDCFSNNSQFRTASIALPWHDSLAVIPVMQVENPSISRLHMDAGANEDTDTDVEVSTKNSDDERVEKTKTPPIATPLPLTSPSSRIQNINSNISPSDEVEMDLSKKSKNDQDSNHSRTGQQTNPPSSLPSSPPATAVSVVVSSSAVLGKVIEKPTRYEDLISAHCGSSSESSANNANRVTKTSVSEKDHRQQDVIRESQEIGKQGSNNSADDTLKLTFYNEGRKETTKEFHTTMEPGGASAGANDLRYFEHGLQMSRVIREPGSEVGSEGNVRMRPQQQHLAVESSESRSGDNDKVSTDDNTQNPKSPSNANSHSTSSNNNSNNLSGTTASIITQPQQLRLTSSIIQNLNNINNNATTSNNSVISNENNGSTSHDKDASTNGKGRQWEGLQISRCQKEGTSVITLEGESNDRVSNMEIPSESSLNTTTSTRNPPESEKGENENSIERHLQTYLTSLRYVKPAESGSESGAGQETETSNKGRSPVISPQSRPTQTNIISPVISPHISSPGSRSGPGSVTSVVRMPSIQRVSPSQQASSLDSWPERTIARIPTRPFLRRNSTYELQQQQPHHQQPVLPRPPSYHAATQQPRMPTATTPISAGSASAAVITATPLQSPPKRFKASHVPPASPMMAHYQSQSQQSQQQYQQAYNLSNKYSNVNNPSEPTQQQHQSRMVTNVHPQQQISQQQQPHVPTSSNAPRIAQQHHHIQAYNNLHHYNQRQSTQTQHHTVTPSNAAHITQRPHFSPGNAQYTHQQQQQSQQQQSQQQQQQSPQQYQTKYHTNSNQQSQNNQQQQQQQLQFQRHLQESLLIASTAMASSSEPVDSSYNERLRRYCEFYHRQELDYSKLQEYYKKYGFYPWDILTARDESIIRQMKSQEYEQQQPEHYQYRQQPEAREGHTTSIANRYEMTRRVEMENAPLQQHHQHQIASRTMNVVNSPGRVAPHFSPSKPATLVAQAAMVPGNTHNSAVVASGRNANITPSIVSPHSSTVQNRYSHNNAQQLQQLHQQREYEVHQQRMNSRYFQSEHHHNQQQQQQQNYNHYEQQQQQQQQPRTVEMRGNTNYDIQNSPHYRSAYNQLAAAAAVVSAGTAAVVSQTQMRAVEQRPANTQNPVRHLIHAQAGGANNRPVVMTVSDPVPAPPDAVPLNIHRQALEQVIKSSQAATNLSMRGDTYGGVGSSRDINYRHAQGSTPTPSQSLHHVNHPMHQQQARQGQSYAVGRVRNEDSTAGGGATQHKEPLRVVPSPTLAHQTSVIRRIQQQESPPAPFVPGQSHNRYMSDRPGISYRRLSSSSSSSADPSGEGGGQPTAFLYQQQKEMSSMHAQYQQQHQQHQSSLSANRRIGSYETGQAMQRGTLKRRIIITDNNGVNQNLTERCAGTASSPIPLIAGEEELVGPRNMSPSTIVRTAVNEELPEDDRADSGDGGGWQYDHVVLLDKRIKTYMCKRCFETLKTEQQIRNHLFCKMLANHVQCHVCLQLVTSDTYPAHLLIHGVRPPDNIEIDN